MPYLNINSNYATNKTINIYYEEYGSGMPLLLLHGGFGSIQDFQKVISEILETKSSMGLIVAVLTTGSCGVVGGALFGSIAEQEFDKEYMVRAFLAAGITGVFIANKYTFSAEEGGCQVETGAGAAMAAAGLVEMDGGTAKQAMTTASMALQNMLGLICDPVIPYEE